MVRFLVDRFNYLFVVCCLIFILLQTKFVLIVLSMFNRVNISFYGCNMNSNVLSRISSCVIQSDSNMLFKHIISRTTFFCDTLR